ncbi:hypothetical protein BKA70DRAFT_1442926 [Coprinopsis sp. MPI-PUGE-AT-0042]|nr:hypothetical protein BKA70DRAFT_1442926 [Coprinopsis sp. MPI-PUGE-AT-0042]
MTRMIRFQDTSRIPPEPSTIPGPPENLPDPQPTRRALITREFVETERKFVNQLELMHELLESKMKDMAQLNALIDVRELNGFTVVLLREFAGTPRLGGTVYFFWQTSLRTVLTIIAIRTLSRPQQLIAATHI